MSDQKETKQERKEKARAYREWKRQEFYRNGDFFRIETPYSCGDSDSLNGFIAVIHFAAAFLAAIMHVSRSVGETPFSLTWFIPATVLVFAWAYLSYRYIKPALKLRTALSHLGEAGVIGKWSRRTMGFLNFAVGITGLAILTWPASQFPLRLLFDDLMTVELQALQNIFSVSATAGIAIGAIVFLFIAQIASTAMLKSKLATHRSTLPPLGEEPEEVYDDPDYPF